MPSVQSERSGERARFAVEGRLALGEGAPRLGTLDASTSGPSAGCTARESVRPEGAPWR